MSWLSRFIERRSRDRMDRNIDDEIQFHLAARAEDLTRVEQRHKTVPEARVSA